MIHRSDRLAAEIKDECEWLAQNHPTVGQFGTPESDVWETRAIAHDCRGRQEMKKRNPGFVLRLGRWRMLRVQLLRDF